MDPIDLLLETDWLKDVIRVAAHNVVMRDFMEQGKQDRR
jgi:hypothetical protein